MAELAEAKQVIFAGDMIASLDSAPQYVPGTGAAPAVLVMPEAEAVGTSSDLYRLVEISPETWALERRRSPSVWTDVTGFDHLKTEITPIRELGRSGAFAVVTGGPAVLLIDIRGELPRDPATLRYDAPPRAPSPAPAAATLPRIGFAAGTRIATPMGQRPVEALTAGDLILTPDGSSQRLRRVRSYSSSDLGQPLFLIEAGAMGRGLPVADCLIAPDQPVLLRSQMVQDFARQPAVMVPARHLRRLKGVMNGPAEPVTLHALFFDTPTIIYANGLEVGGRNAEPGKGGGDAVPLFNGPRGRRLIDHHIKGQSPLIDTFGPPRATAAE